MFKDKNRFKNVGLWLSIVAYVSQVILNNLGYQNVLDQNTKNIIDAIFFILISLGILNNPTTQNRFYSDDSEE